MHETAFISDYTSMTADGAQWVVDNSEIQLVGIDYTSIATYDDLTGPHIILLPNVCLNILVYLRHSVSQSLHYSRASQCYKSPPELILDLAQSSAH